MNYKAHEVIVLHPDQLTSLIETAIAPLVERLDKMEKKMVSVKIGYSPKEAAELIGISDRLIRKWIIEGKVDARGKTHYLKGYQPTENRWRIMPEDLTEFIKHF